MSYNGCVTAEVGEIDFRCFRPSLGGKGDGEGYGEVDDKDYDKVDDKVDDKVYWV